jgi:hypothetical protein
MQFDRVLDRDTTGPLWLKDASAANAVSNVLIRGATDWRLYNLHAWVIMANHVHVLIRPRVPLNKALMNIKAQVPAPRMPCSTASANHSGKANPMTTGSETTANLIQSFAIFIEIP